MRAYDIIMKKRDGEILSKEEIEFMVNGFTNGSIPDYQMSAFLMSIYFNGLNKEETLDLTLSMRDSGDIMDLSVIKGVKVDKHSTGGVGDKTSLIIAPMIASLNMKMAKMSGRGLGHTGGTIDKLESIKGFNTAISEEEFIDNVNNIGIAIVGQTKNLTPADKKIYALRDVTATVDQKSLIASSIMSKKLASGSDVIVLDVTCGSGAFMKDYEKAKELAECMVEIGNGAGKKTIAVITDMNEPLGNFVGNGLEVYEAYCCLKGKGNQRLMDTCYALASQILIGAGVASNVEEATLMLKQTIEDGSAYKSFLKFVEAQGGDIKVFDHINSPDDFITVKYKEQVYLKDAGYLETCNTSEVGITSLILGGGRETKESEIDLNVGIELHAQLGDYVDQEHPLATLYANDLDKLKNAKERLISAYTVKNEPIILHPVIYDFTT